MFNFFSIMISDMIGAYEVLIYIQYFTQEKQKYICIILIFHNWQHYKYVYLRHSST